MLPLRLIPLAVAGLAAVAATTAPLRVIRSTPVGVSDPITEIAVSFDRPVAGSIERAIDAATVMRISPAIAGRFTLSREVAELPNRSGQIVHIILTTTWRSTDGRTLSRSCSTYYGKDGLHAYFTSQI